MDVVTVDHLPNREIVETLGVVTAFVVRGVSWFSEIKASITDVIGFRSGSLEGHLGDARDAAYRTITQQAQDLGADAIIGLRIEFSPVGKGDQSMLAVSMYGTAVRTTVRTTVKIG